MSNFPSQKLAKVIKVAAAMPPLTKNPQVKGSKNLGEGCMAS
jgi:hypothetical protein